MDDHRLMVSALSDRSDAVEDMGQEVDGGKDTSLLRW